MNQTALVTGASSGIGYEFAKILGREGYNLVLVARRLNKLTELKEELERNYKVEIHLIPADLTIPGICNSIFNEIESKNIEVDVLVNNAGFGTLGAFKESEWKKQEQMIQLNIIALTHLTRLIIPVMIKRKKGEIINVASTAAFFAGPFMSVYYATKAYVLSFSQAIANELKDFNITVTALCPGPTASEFQATAQMEEAKLVKLKKLPTSKEVAEYGLKALKEGKTVAIHGWDNKMLAVSSRLTPRNIATKIVRWLQENKGNGSVSRT